MTLLPEKANITKVTAPGKLIYVDDGEQEAVTVLLWWLITVLFRHIISSRPLHRSILGARPCDQ